MVSQIFLFEGKQKKGEGGEISFLKLRKVFHIHIDTSPKDIYSKRG